MIPTTSRPTPPSSPHRPQLGPPQYRPPPPVGARGREGEEEAVSETLLSATSLPGGPLPHYYPPCELVWGPPFPPGAPYPPGGPPYSQGGPPYPPGGPSYPPGMPPYPHYLINPRPPSRQHSFEQHDKVPPTTPHHGAPWSSLHTTLDPAPPHGHEHSFEQHDKVPPTITLVLCTPCPAPY